jgi:hypothetical protein
MGLVGHWTELVEAESPADLDSFTAERRLVPAMGVDSARGESAFSPPMIIRERRTGQPVGFVENHAMPGGVAVLVVYMNRQRGRPGYGVEAAAIYISHLFDCGARLVVCEVLSLNDEALGIMRKAGWEPQARLRDHVYAAGRFWDLLIFSFDRTDWLRTAARYRRILPGGTRQPVAIGVRRSRD